MPPPSLSPLSTGMSIAAILTFYALGSTQRRIEKEVELKRSARAGERAVKIVGNIPLQNAETDLPIGNFSPTMTKEREEALVNFVQKIFQADSVGEYTGSFEVETNLLQDGSTTVAGQKSLVKSKSASDESIWWRFRYTSKSLFPEDEHRWLPISFLLYATDRPNDAQYTFCGAVQSIVIESDSDLVKVADVQTPSLKIYFTLVDTNWKNLGQTSAPQTIKVLTTVTNGFVTSTLLAAKTRDGADATEEALPIFVSGLVLRLERSPVAFGDNLFKRFYVQGTSLALNTEPDSDAENGIHQAIASLCIHENLTAPLSFFFRALPLLYAHSVDVKAWNTKLSDSDAFYQHSVEALPGKGGLPMLLTKSDHTEVYAVKRVTVSTPTKFADIGEVMHDSNMIRQIILDVYPPNGTPSQYNELDDSALDTFSFETGSQTEKWMFNGSTPVEATGLNLKLLSAMNVRFLASNLPLDASLDGKLHFSTFTPVWAPHSQFSYSLPVYEKLHCLHPSLSLHQIDARPRSSYLAGFVKDPAETAIEPTFNKNARYAVLALIILCAILGAKASRLSAELTRADAFLGSLCAGLAVFLFILGITVNWGSDTSAIIRSTNLVLKWTATGIIATSVVFGLLTFSSTGAPPFFVVLAIAFLAFTALVSHVVPLHLFESGLNDDLRLVFGFLCTLAGFAAALVATWLIFRFKDPENRIGKHWGWGSALGSTARILLLLFFLALLVVGARRVWSKNCARAFFTKERAATRARDLRDSRGSLEALDENESKLHNFYLVEEAQTQTCGELQSSVTDTSATRSYGIIVLSLLAVLWIFGLALRFRIPHFSAARREYASSRTPPPSSGLGRSQVMAWILPIVWNVGCQILVQLMLLRLLEAIPALVFETTRQQVCSDARQSFQAYSELAYGNADLEFDAAQKEAEIIDDFSRLRCYPTEGQIITKLAFALFAFVLVSMSVPYNLDRPPRNGFNLSTQALFTIFCAILACAFTRTWSEKQKSRLLSVDVMDVFNNFLRSLYNPLK